MGRQIDLGNPTAHIAELEHRVAVLEHRTAVLTEALRVLTRALRGGQATTADVEAAARAAQHGEDLLGLIMDAPSPP